MTAPLRRPSQRGQLVIRAALALAAKHSTPSADAPLLTLAAELRALEAAFSQGCDRQDEYDCTPEGEALVQAIGERLGRMAGIRSIGLAGIAAKAGRICWSLEDVRILSAGEVLLGASLAADLARLAPEALGRTA